MCKTDKYIKISHSSGDQSKGKQRDLRKSGRTPSDRKGPDKLDLILVRNIVEYFLRDAKPE